MNDYLKPVWNMTNLSTGGAHRILETYWSLGLFSPQGELEKEQTNPKDSRRKEVSKIRTEINKIKIIKTIEKISRTKLCF